jgi:hypothetical protein
VPIPVRGLPFLVAIILDCFIGIWYQIIGSDAREAT